VLRPCFAFATGFRPRLSPRNPKLRLWLAPDHLRLAVEAGAFTFDCSTRGAILHGFLLIMFDSMKFFRYARSPQREITSRRLSAARRAIQRDKDSWALFPEYVRHHTAEERIAAVDEDVSEGFRLRRKHRADAWRRARAAVRQMPIQQRRDALEFWQRGIYPASPEYLLGLIRSITTGRFNLAEYDREIESARRIGLQERLRANSGPKTCSRSLAI
jgi:hypothetical protein